MTNVELAIEKTMAGKQTFCKLLSPNDSGETGGHQSGFLISTSAKDMLFSQQELSEHIAKRNIKIKWQDDFYTDGCLSWYESKKELRITRFTRGFPMRGAEYTGALFVFVKNSIDDYAGFIFNTEDDIDEYLNAFGLTPAETNCPIQLGKADATIREERAISDFIGGLTIEFPSSSEMSYAARMISYAALLNQHMTVMNPDRALLDWTDEEYKLFRALEQERYGHIVSQGFKSVDEFVELANKVLNRRKSRAGKSLEHHLAAIFDENNISYTAQAVTEGNKKPDFIFPSENAYHDMNFPTEKLVSLAAKTTCKDRWRQILNEADRLRDGHKYLCTLQQGISSAQMNEMEAEGVILVVPKAYITTYPKDKQSRIWTIKKFVTYIREIENV
ncbi:MAG: type II restriction endonuclease [Bacteroides thetaiotaomicron]|nr:type II restriction endonuclease [Bacteroides thetaiotaomicron]